MATYSILTTRAQEAALNYAWKQSQLPPPTPPPPGTDPPPVLTQEQFFQQQVSRIVLNDMVRQYDSAKHANVIVSLETIPEPNRDAARTEIDATITKYGGTPTPPI